MILEFKLTMPNANTRYRSQPSDVGNYIYKRLSKSECERLLGNHYYDFGDGWGANIECSIVSKRKKNNGFRGYEWMVDELLDFCKIFTVEERRYKNAFEDAFKSWYRTDFTEQKGVNKLEFDFLAKNIKRIIFDVNYEKLINLTLNK
jgi:hypothetical protein